MLISTHTPLVIKVGGSLLEDANAAKSLFAVIKQLLPTRPVLLVHGGGNKVNTILSELGYSSGKIDGLRITPKQHLPYVVGALAGTVNKTLCAWAITEEVTPVGLSLLDGNMCTAKQVSADLGHVGEVTKGSNDLLLAINKLKHLPIISSIAANPKDGLLNVNADDAAAVIAELVEGQLILLSDVPCVLDANKQPIETLTPDDIARLIAEDVIQEGMAVKVNAAMHAATQIGLPVIIASWKTPEKLLGLLAGEAIGTSVYGELAE